jgi:hypothetical protein
MDSRPSNIHMDPMDLDELWNVVDPQLVDQPVVDDNDLFGDNLTGENSPEPPGPSASTLTLPQDPNPQPSFALPAEVPNPQPSVPVSGPPTTSQAPAAASGANDFTNFTISSALDNLSSNIDLTGFAFSQIQQPQGLPAGPNAAVLNAPKISNNRRRKADANNDPSSIYRKPTGLGPWGPRTGPHRTHLFQYYQTYAELRHDTTFTREDIVAFMKGAGNTNPGRKLTLWIQHAPAQINNRYANGSSSSKCRYKNCPGTSRTILKGFFRVAFDEFSDQTGSYLDPMHNAFYMHLHCFESLFDLGYLIHHGAATKNFQILPDVRQFPFEERNPAALNRDFFAVYEAYNQWVQAQKARADALHTANLTTPSAWYDGLNPIPNQILPHTQRLGFALTEAHLAHQNQNRATVRERRGGANIGIHKGDLELYERLRKRGENANKTFSASLNPNKRKRGAVNDDDAPYIYIEDDEEEEDEDEYLPSPHTSRPDKRVRVSTSTPSTSSSSNVRRAIRDRVHARQQNFANLYTSNTLFPTLSSLPQPQQQLQSPNIITNTQRGSLGAERSLGDILSSSRVASRVKKLHKPARRELEISLRKIERQQAQLGMSKRRAMSM